MQEGEGNDTVQLASLTVPGLLLRVLRHNISAIDRPADVLVLATHAAMLETGFQPTWASAAAGSSTAAADLAVSARYTLPPECCMGASFYRLGYSHPEAAPGDEAAGAAGGEAASSGADVGAAGGSDASPPCCMVGCSVMGGSVLIAASTPRGHLHHKLLAAAAFMESGPPASAAEEGSAEAGPSSSGGVQLLPGNGLRLGGRLGLTLPAAGVRQLWRALKDSLAFPMLLAVFTDAGLPPPAGLLALPEDVKQALLERLPVSGGCRRGRAGPACSCVGEWAGGQRLNG